MKHKNRVLIKPFITEKSLDLVERLNQYTFLVADNATKMMVEKAVEKQFDVEVEKVRIINVRGKRVNWGRSRLSGKRQDIKKAIVTLDSNDSIDLFKVK